MPVRLSRRTLLRSTPLAGFALSAGAQSSEPRNISSSLAAVQGTLTPADLFFVREHFSQPDLSLLSWKLRVEGHVKRPLEVSFSDLLLLPVTKLEAVLECAGNGPGGFAVSNGVWEGVPLAALLSDAGVTAGAEEVLLEGADEGRLSKSASVFPYARIVPLAKCLSPEAMVAFKLNGRFLPRRNGFPARAFLAGWYGMDSVKWLRRIVVLGPADRPPSYYESGMTQAYVRVIEGAQGQQVSRITGLRVKSQIASPATDARLTAGPHLVWGFAWSGMAPVRQVQVSADGGATWGLARVEPAASRQAWARWSFAWKAEPGEHVLMARAEDESGKVQPLIADPARKDQYEMNYCAPVRCFVR